MDFMSITMVADELNINTETIKRWYKWWEDDNYTKPKDLKLPKTYIFDKKKTRMFATKDIKTLQTFKEKVNTTHRGVLAEFNRNHCWKKEKLENE